MKKKKATLEDVAREAGVSICTVSRVIHNKGYISENTRKRVEEAIYTETHKGWTHSEYRGYTLSITENNL